MGRIGVFGRMGDFWADLLGKNKFGKYDFGVLKAMMMLAATAALATPPQPITGMLQACAT